jgi:hypothetical protein
MQNELISAEQLPFSQVSGTGFSVATSPSIWGAARPAAGYKINIENTTISKDRKTFFTITSFFRLHSNTTTGRSDIFPKPQV